MKVQVCIIGGGPSGLLLSQLLHLKGIDANLEKISSGANYSAIMDNIARFKGQPQPVPPDQLASARAACVSERRAQRPQHRLIG